MSFIATVIAGLVFLWTGFLKTVSPRTFQAHLFQIGWIPKQLVNASVLIVAALEAALGSALVVGFHLELVTVLSIIAVVGLSATTIIAVKRGRTNDCGCYAGYFAPSFTQTLLINGALVTLLALALMNPERPVLTHFQSGIVVVGIATAVFALTAVTLDAWVSRGVRYFDESPIKLERPWNNRWSGSVDALSADEMFVVYLSRDCPFCSRWISVLNGMHENRWLPDVIGMLAESRDAANRYAVTTGARFPIHPISSSLKSRLVDGVPTGVLVSQGKISDIWTGEISPAFLNRFKQAFFAAS